MDLTLFKSPGNHFRTFILPTRRFIILGKNDISNEILMQYVISRKEFEDRIIMHPEGKGPFCMITNIIFKNGIES